MDPLRPVALKQKFALAREFRHSPTPVERYAWSLLRNRQLLGLKFRRQHVLHGFVVDFFCPALNLVLELDGGHHDDAQQASYDADRTAWLKGAGYQMIRLRNADLTRDRIRDEILKIFPTDPT